MEPKKPTDVNSPVDFKHLRAIFNGNWTLKYPTPDPKVDKMFASCYDEPWNNRPKRIFKHGIRMGIKLK